MKPTVIILAVAAVVLLLTVVAVVFMFGTPQAPEPAALAAESGVPSPATGAGTSPGGASPMNTPTGGGAGGGDVPITENAEVPAPDPNVPLAIEIPGCKCHSDDPKVVEEHSKYRMNQCAGCHSGQVPTGQ